MKRTVNMVLLAVLGVLVGVASCGGPVFAEEARLISVGTYVAGDLEAGTAFPDFVLPETDLVDPESDFVESAETDSDFAGAVAGKNKVSVSRPVRTGVSFFRAEATNPAVVGLGEPGFRLRLAPFTATVGNDAWAWTTLDYYMDKPIPLADRKQLVEAVPQEGLGLRMNTSHGAVLGIGSFSAQAGIRTIFTGNLAPDLFELLFLGNKLNESYTLDASVGAVAFGDASVGLGLRIGPRIRVGARYHQLLEAIYLEQTIKAKGEFVYTDGEAGLRTDIGMSLTVMHPEEVSGARMGGGTGSAFDVGAIVLLSDDVSVGVAVLDIGRIEWSSVASSTCAVQFGRSDEATDGGEQAQDCTPERSDRMFRWNLPRRYEISAGWQLPWGFHLGTAYTLTTHREADGFSIKNRGELGAMLVWERLKFLQLGVGTTYGKASGLSVNAGASLRLGPLQTRAHMSDVQVLFGRGRAKEFGLGVDLGIVF